MTTSTTRSSAVVAAVFSIGLLVTACAPASPSTPADVATELANAFIAADVDRANELLCEGGWEKSDPDSYELGVGAPDRWDFSGFEYSIREETEAGEVLGNLGEDVEFDVTTNGDGDALCVSALSINGAKGYVKE
ncbi:hypothetical protein [uncultured Microbacterium sp.]|uniref:hypothetical protein n=1 Tax=uncultured Microbacterium sp. TaxID=191216 RepID=UPI0028D2B168|nr:hypothetical protein [uncultured Microbacterium sp.]